MKYFNKEVNIITGYIKEMLHNFNLPMIPVYTEDTIPYEGRTYIKGLDIVKYVDGEFVTLAPYNYNLEILNVTKKLQMNSSTYDIYTHEYLGEFLRFIRDFKHLDLMCLYNCFAERMPLRVFFGGPSDRIRLNLPIEVDTDNKNFNYYIVPIKFNKIYTIALDSEVRYELTSILYGKNFIDATPNKLIKESYRTISGSKFTSPYTYSTYFSTAKDLWDKESCLCLLIKIPNEVRSSIAILEGNYTDSANVVDGTYVNDYFYGKGIKNSALDYGTKLSLLKVNTRENVPFADRLIEYLLKNVINNIDTIKNNVERVQDIVYTDEFEGYYGIWDNHLRNKIYGKTLDKDITKGSSVKTGNTIEVSNPTHSSTETFVQEKRFIDVYDDVLGYVDKDVESLLRLL